VAAADEFSEARRSYPPERKNGRTTMNATTTPDQILARSASETVREAAFERLAAANQGDAR